jgi:4-amino-4-deoxy-L-arabinose transferase-like glycosyltransferase
MARALGRFVIRRYRLCVLLVLALMALNVFAGVAASAISDSDEARYGVSAFEMLRHRSFIVTTYAGHREYWNLKPPLGYWLLAASFRVFGPSAFALRLPSALFALGVVAATMAFSRRWGNRRASILAGLIVATAFGFLSFHGARNGDLDAALTFLLLLAAMQLPHLGESPWRVVALGLILSCGFLLKSFAILPMVGVAVAYAAVSGSWRRQRAVPCALAIGLFVLVVASWSIARYHADGSSYFLRRMVREDLVARSTRLIDKGASTPLTYTASLFDRFAPWPELTLVALLLALRARGWRPRALWRRAGRGVVPLLLLWVLIPLVMFSASKTQHHWYMDPAYPGFAMLAALAVFSLLRRTPPGWRQGAALVGCLVVPLALCETRVLHRALVRDRMPASQRFLLALGDRVGTCRRLHATFPLWHSERFLLEAVGRFEVTDTRDAGAAAAARLGAGTCVLVARARWSAPAPGEAELLARSRDYLLYRGVTREVTRSLLASVPEPEPVARRHAGPPRARPVVVPAASRPQPARPAVASTADVETATGPFPDDVDGDSDSDPSGPVVT